MLILYLTSSHLEMHLQYGRGGGPNISKRSAYFSNIWTGRSKYLGSIYHVTDPDLNGPESVLFLAGYL